MKPDTIEIELVLAHPGQVARAHVSLPAGSTLGEAVRQSGLLERDAGESHHWRFAIYGKLRAQTHILESGDRIEIVRPLLVDPNEARLARARSKARRAPD
jgi:putative ubiquitin-RnfH superfamily antitoxin RatB of RatAB toxin-antitoxin module